MASLKEGKKAPDFSLPSSDGGKIALKDFKGKKRGGGGEGKRGRRKDILPP